MKGSQQPGTTKRSIFYGAAPIQFHQKMVSVYILSPLCYLKASIFGTNEVVTIFVLKNAVIQRFAAAKLFDVFA